MDDNARAFARNMLRLRIHESDGQAYEDLFVRVMVYANPNFRPVKAYGRIGDKKNDGYDSDAGAYYQVYAPGEIKRSGRTAIQKLRADFKGLKASWENTYAVRSFHYVINDKYHGVGPDLEQELADIRVSNKLDAAKPFLAKDLEATVFSLPSDQIISIVGHVPFIDATEFLFLSGFTYFIGAWIAFERVGRRRVECAATPRRGAVGRALIQDLDHMSLLSPDEVEMLRSLSETRNVLIHGDTTDLPTKDMIDKLVALTERIDVPA